VGTKLRLYSRYGTGAYEYDRDKFRKEHVQYNWIWILKSLFSIYNLYSNIKCYSIFPLLYGDILATLPCSQLTTLIKQKYIYTLNIYPLNIMISIYKLILHLYTHFGSIYIYSLRHIFLPNIGSYLHSNICVWKLKPELFYMYFDGLKLL